MQIELRDVNDDWEELLIDGEVVLSGHRLTVNQVIPLVAPDDDFQYTQVYHCIYCDAEMPDWDGGRFVCGNCEMEAA